MATVIGIFEDKYIKKKPLPIVRPGTQSRRFTHIDDTVMVCYKAWKKIDVNITAFQIKSYTIKQVANFLNKNQISSIKKRLKDTHQHYQV